MKKILISIIVLLPLSFMAVIYQAGPTGHAEMISADLSIPVMMVNEPHASIYSYYYYGQNRLGSWPYLLFFLIKRILNLSAFQVEDIFMMYTFLTLLSVFGLALVRPGRYFLTTLVLFAIMSFHPGILAVVYDFSLPYGAQLFALSWYWYFIDRYLKGRRSRMNLLMTGLFGYLALWSSSLSLVFMVIILGWYFLIRSWYQRKWYFRQHKALIIVQTSAILISKIMNEYYHYRVEDIFGLKYFFAISAASTAIDLIHLPGNMLQNFMALTSIYI